MLNIVIPEKELWDDRAKEFIYIPKGGYAIQLEHSLISLSRWESKWKKPFLSSKEKTYEETLDYIRCMTLTKNIPYEAYYALETSEIELINEYIAAQMTATTIRKDKSMTSSRAITSELIYYWMIANSIPFECEKWHLSRLLMLIDVCVEESKPPKQRSKAKMMEERSALMNQRRQKYAKK